MIIKPNFATLSTGDLVLASASATRAKLLTDSGLVFCQYPVNIDEDAVRMAGMAEMIPPSDIAIALAEMKASAAAQLLSIEGQKPSGYILGCDQILAYENQIYNKPLNAVAAKSQLMALSGKTHQLYTAVVLLQHGNRIWHHLSVADITMRKLDSDFIDAYIKHIGDEALISPASYQIEGPGAHLLSKISGCHYGILGIPLLELLEILRKHGLTFHEKE
ncbi:Maf family protein [Candidatus Puniceispirillum sp.]|nr:Maf family protein [Candidatus Puniceispirillum sp.]